MKIESARKLGQTSGKRASGASAGGSIFSPTGVEEQRGAAALSGPASLSAIDSLLALQERGSATDPRTNRRRAIKRGEQMLDILDDVKIALLGGEIPRAKLARLLFAVESERQIIDDPQLADVLAHIELRARVELAKFGSLTQR